MSRLEEFVSLSTSTYHDGLYEMEKNVNKKFDCIQQVINELYENSDVFVSKFNQGKEQMANLHDKQRITLDQSLNLREKSDQLEARAQAQKSLLESGLKNSQQIIQSELEKVISLIAKQRTQVEDLVMQQNASFNKLNQLRASVFSDVKGKFEAIFNEQSQLIDNLIFIMVLILICFSLENEILFFKTEMERIQAEKNKFEQSKSQKWDQLEKLFNEFKVEQIRENNSFVKSASGLITKIDQTVNSNVEKGKNFINHVDNSDQIMLNEEKSVLTFIDKVDELSTKNTQIIIDQCHETMKKNDQISDEMMKTVVDQEIIQDIKDSMEINNQMIGTIDQQIKENETALNQLDNMFSSEITMQNETINKIGKNLGSAVELIAEKTKDMVRSGNTSEKAIIRDIGSCLDDVKYFIKNDLAKVVPTGTTPQKTDYQYPRELIETSPHDKILRRLRTALDPSEALAAPLPEESDSELASATSSTLGSNLSIDSVINNENCPAVIPSSTESSKSVKSVSCSDLKKIGSKKQGHNEKMKRSVRDQKVLQVKANN